MKTIRTFGKNIIASHNILPKQTNDHIVDLYRSINGTPAENLIKVIEIEMMGGDETLAAMSEAEKLNGDFVSIDDFAK